MKTLTLSLLLSALSPPVLLADDNVRGVCISGQTQTTDPTQCLVKTPGVYEGGDTVYLKSFSAGLFLFDPNGPSDTPPLQLAPQAVGAYALKDDARTKTQCTARANLAVATDSYIGPSAFAGTLQKVWCITSGTIVTSPQVRLAECSSTGASCADNTATLTCDADGDSTTTFGGAAGSGIDADDWMQFNLQNTPSVTDGVTTFCFSYL